MVTVTTNGRAVAVVACFMGLGSIAAMILTIDFTLRFTQREKKAYTDLIKTWEYYELLVNRSIVIQRAWRLYFLAKNGYVSDPNKKKWYQCLSR